MSLPAPEPANPVPDKTGTRGKLRLTVVSPFLDKRHGTERCIAEQLERLAGAYEIHLYSERVEEDVDLSNITWHPVFIPPGPHLLRYLWWFAANHLCRWIDRHFRGPAPGLVYSPGVNCLDADVICVHIVFAEFWDQVKKELSLSGSTWRAWPVLVHRRMYYRLVQFLERCAYNRDKVSLCAVSEKTAEAIHKYCGCQKLIKVVYNGVDVIKFNPERRRGMRSYSRATLGLAENAFAVLLIGNDWKKKGLQHLIEAAGKLADPNIRILVAGRDNAEPFQERIRRLGISAQVLFLPVRPDVEFYYAAADAYAGPSLDDSFAMPPLEAMACALPVITTRFNGGCAIMHHGVDGLILEDPSDSLTLSAWLQRLSTDTEWRTSMGDAAARTASQYTWERNAAEIRSILDSAAEVRIARERAVKGTRS